MFRQLLLLFFISISTRDFALAQPSVQHLSADSLLEQAMEWPRKNPTKALALTAQIIHSSTASDSIKGEAYNLRGVALVSLGTRDSALWYYQKALTIFEKSNQLKAIAATSNHIGRFYRKDNFNEALKFYDRALEIYTSLGDEDGRATILNESGVAFEYAGQYDAARSRYATSLEMRRQAKDTIGIAYSLEFISGVLMLEGQYQEALNYNLEAWHLRKKINDTFGLCLNALSLARIYFHLENYEAAMTYARESEALSIAMEYIDIRPSLYALLRDISKARKQVDSALFFSSKYDLYKDSIFALDKNRQVEALTALYEASKKETLIQQQQFELSRKN